MEPMGLLSLPVELLQHISGYLTKEDILTCSRTCHHLRFAFNDNSVWRRFLPEGITALESKEPQVFPLFKLETSAGLAPLCKNRVHFMRKTHLLNNWRTENFTDYRIGTSSTYATAMFNRTKGRGKLMYKDRYIFLSRFVNDVESDAIEVWDTGKDLILHTSISMKNQNYDSFYVVGDRLVVVDCFKVIVYEITIPEKVFPIAFSFLITEESVTLNDEVIHPGRHDFRCVGWCHYSAGRYLASNKCAQVWPILHVWDIENAFKLGSFMSPINGFSMNIHSYNKNDWLLWQNMQSEDDIYYLHFDTEKKIFSDSIFTYKGFGTDKILFFGSYVILFKSSEDDKPCTICTVHDFNTSVELERRYFDNPSRSNHFGSTVVVNGIFVAFCINSFQTIDARSLKTMNIFPCDGVRYITRQLNVFDSLVLITCNNDYRLGVWDVKSEKKMNNFLKEVYTCHFSIDDLCTRLVCFDRHRISLFHFW